MNTEFMTLKRFIELELAKIEPQWTAEGKGSYWWGVKIGLETALAKLCEMEGQAPREGGRIMNIEQERAQFEAWYRLHHGSRNVYGRDASGEYADNSELEAENTRLKARLAEALKALDLFEHYGCPICHGDCASANPPVDSCPMQAASRVRKGG